MTTLPPFSTVILKLTAFCNLNCSYCYMFNLADRTFERVPRYCSTEVALATVRRLADHVRAEGRTRMHVVLHGGEPLLWPREQFQRLFDEIAAIRASGLEVGVSLQTNGLQTPREVIALLSRHDVTLGFSLDGPRELNDRLRVLHNGAGSYDRVIASLARTLDGGFDPRKVGVLSVVNPALSPRAFLEWAAGLPVRNVSVLWPIEFSWRSPPWGAGSEERYRAAPVYGRWMAETFVAWWEGYLERLRVRQFLDTIARLMGSRRHSDSIGNDFVDILVVNTDGGIEYPDYLRAHHDGGSRTPYSILRDDLGEVRQKDPLFRTLLGLSRSLPAECRGCHNQDVCGGGFLAGRATAAGFEASRRSVLCHDQMYYFDAVRAAVTPYLQAMAAVEADDAQAAEWDPT